LVPIVQDLDVDDVVEWLEWPERELVLASDRRRGLRSARDRNADEEKDRAVVAIDPVACVPLSCRGDLEELQVHAPVAVEEWGDGRPFGRRLGVTAVR